MHTPFLYYPSTSNITPVSRNESSYIPASSFYNGYSSSIIHSRPDALIGQPSSSRPQISSTFNSHSTTNRIRQPFSSSRNAEDDFLFHEQQLNRNLAQNGFQRLPVKGDGNCLFYALAEGLIYEMNRNSQTFGVSIQQALNLPSHFRLTELSDRLRKLCVEQWRHYENYYSQFIDQENVDFLREVRKFSRNGVSESILGDIVPLTIANALDIQITIFTSLIDLPRINVKAEHRTHLRSSHPKIIYLAYNQYGSGHYDAAHPY